MGEVYRATDTNLKRQVAIKVLPPSLGGDAERLARFQREAEVLAALNHPNIAAIYGLEKTSDFTALVMELVEGDDLSQRIARGAIPLDEALPIAKQIAEAPRSRARAGDHPSRSEAREHQGPRRRHGEGARLRPREGDGACRGLVAGRLDVAHNHFAGDDAGGDDPRHGGLHVAGAGAREAGGQARGHLGVWRGALRDADRARACSRATRSRKRLVSFFRANRIWRRCQPLRLHAFEA